MTVNPITGKGNPPAQVQGSQSKGGEEAFHEFAKSEGYDKNELDEAVSQRTRLTRATRSHRTPKKHSSLFLVSDEDELSEEPIYRTVMVDGMLFTLRLIAVA